MAAPSHPSQSWMVGPVTDAVGDTLTRIEARDPELHAFITIDADGALASAASCDERHALGTPIGPFDGVVVAVKDCLDTAGLRTTRGSSLYANRVPGRDAAVVESLRQAGAIICGKTNLTELSCGTVGYNASFGDIANPVDAAFYPGGSSSGSAAAIGAGLIDYAIGTDTSCSVRVPAAFCGVVGLKPTFDRVPTDGNAILARTLDHVGPMGSNVAAVAELLAVIQRDVWPDPSTALAQEQSKTARRGADLRVGILSGPFIETASAAVTRSYSDVIEALSGAGVVLGDVAWTVDLAEADDWANLLAVDMVEAFGADADASPGLLGDDLNYWLDRYRQVSPEEYAEALGVQARIRAQVISDLHPFDVVVCPTVRHGAQRWEDVELWSRADRIENCSIWSLTGHPALSVPWGTSEAGMPLGLQIIGRHGHDEDALRLGLLVEQIAGAS